MRFSKSRSHLSAACQWSKGAGLLISEKHRESKNCSHVYFNNSARTRTRMHPTPPTHLDQFLELAVCIAQLFDLLILGSMASLHVHRQACTEMLQLSKLWLAQGQMQTAQVDVSFTQTEGLTQRAHFELPFQFIVHSLTQKVCIISSPRAVLLIEPWTALRQFSPGSPDSACSPSGQTANEKQRSQNQQINQAYV